MQASVVIWVKGDLDVVCWGIALGIFLNLRETPLKLLPI